MARLLSKRVFLQVAVCDSSNMTMILKTIACTYKLVIKSWIWNPRYKQEYLNIVQSISSWPMGTGVADDESKKHLEARNVRYSCLIMLLQQ